NAGRSLVDVAVISLIRIRKLCGWARSCSGAVGYACCTGETRSMLTQPSQRLHRWPLAVLLCLSGGFAVAADPSGTAGEGPLRPSASAFDALFRRLDVGDLLVVGNRRQKEYVARLQQLAPAGDAHRARLL